MIKVVKTIKARLVIDEKQSKQLQDLYTAWNKMLKYCVHNHFSQLWRKVRESALYAPVRK
jgi:hypothetical protein